ncbi:hypothetical protein L226DRAFT_536161 [Lentinus tigrinus ALCF2SS1-7]|uniref:B30.2/SPRY domain-containing protein n=1 Tax=Lentinus tigrinus ALCF2SS1-6 TaxID=1328759 RepID=A0A5C2S648_9APHY|nr:hypothetical protein L227DRAFT_164223 [Lentinus tigrinus ALCF2SS1-6]RPD73480.1 hypothetical protein L226DRAFT_536161 [Lentinus tigrinus ALCF2SS1-7]
MEVASRETSPPATATPPSLPVHPHHHPQPSRKRKHAAIAHAAASSPAPSDPGATPAPENLVLSHRHADLASRPRLVISRHPQFVPLAPGSRFYTTEPLFNRMNFRYMPAGVCPPECASPFRTIESKPTSFRISWEDRSPFIHVTPEGLGLQGEKGFRSARCNAPMREGRWYMEVKIELGAGDRAPGLKRKEGSHVRLGWARREAPLNAPAGYDGYSYAMRDKTGEKVHLSRPRPYGRPFKTGDVVGMYICLPPRRKPDKRDPYDPARIKRERIAIEFKGQEYFESLEYAQSKEMIALMGASDRAKATDTKSLPSSTKKSATVKNLPSTGRGKGGVPETTPMRPVPTLGPESYIAFFINGESQGIAFQDLYDFLPLRTPPSKAEQKKRVNREGLREHKENPFDDGTLGYYPFISLFNGAQVQINPGPDFIFTPPPDIDAVVANPGADIKPIPDSKRTWRPACERYPEFMQEQWAMDEQEEIEAKKNLPALQAEWAKQEKADEEKAKRKVHAATRRERKVAHKVQETGSHKRAKTAPEHTPFSPAPTPGPTLGAFPRAESSASLGECYAPPMIIPSSASVPNVRELATPELREGSERIPSPAPTVASSIDAQIAGLAGYGDTSAYNTDDELADLVPHDPQDAGMETDGDVELAEADPIEEAVAYTYAVRRS